MSLGRTLNSVIHSRSLGLVVAVGLACGVSGRMSLGAITNGNWTGNGTDANWNTAGNWSAVPGDTSAITGTNGDTSVATFNAAIANTWGNSAANPVVIDSASENLMGITFTTASGSYFVGSTGGNSLFVSSGGSILVSALSNASGNLVTETVNAPLVIEGASGTYSLTNDGANGTAAKAGVLNFGGSIGGGAAGNTILTISGSNTNANTISGAIGDGLATSLSLVKSGAGSWTLTAGNGYTGSTTVSAGTVTLSGAGAIASSAGLTLNGGKLVLDNSATAVNDRIANDVSLSVGGELALTGNGSASSINEAFGTLGIGTGSSTVTVANTGSGQLQQLAASGFSRSNNGTGLLRGSSIGDGASNSTRITLGSTSGLTLIGAGAQSSTGTAGSAKDLPIVPYLVGDSSATGTGVGSTGNLLTYDTTSGFRKLGTNEQTGLVASSGTNDGVAATDNVKVAKGVAAALSAGDKTFNSLVLSPDNGAGTSAATTVTGAGGGLMLTSGALLDAGGTPNVISGFSSIGFGNGEAVIFRSSGSNSLTINSPIDVSGGGGMTKGGAGNVIVGATALYTGSTIINQGTLTIGNASAGNLNSASAVTITPQGTLGFNMAANDTLSNGIVDNGVITKSGANVNTLSGEISGSGGITINNTGGGALSLSTTVKSFTGATTINEGILRAVGDVLSPNSLLTIASSSTTTNPTLQLRADSDTTFHTGGVQITGVASQVRQWTIDVGNVSTGANRTLTLAGTTFYAGYGSSPNNGTFNVTGTSGYTLAMDGIDLRPLTGGASGPDIQVASGVTLTIGTVTVGTSIGNSTGFTSTGAGDMVVTGDMVRATSSRTMNIAQDGPGSLTLAGSGATTSGSGGYAITLNQGTLNINSNNAIGAGTGMGVRTLAINGGTLDNTSGSAVTSASNSAVAINGSFAFGGTRALNLGTGAVTLGGGSEVSITANGSGEALTLGGVITGGTATGLTKAGPGTLALTGASPSFSLPVTVTGGTLVVGVGGVGSVGSAITVNAGTLAGSGSTTGAVTIGDGVGTADAAISPGNSPGTFTTTAGLSFSADGVYTYELDTTAGSGGTIAANGVTIDPAATFSFNASGSEAGLSDGQVLLLLENTSGSGIGGTFANLADGSTFTSGNFNFTANYSGGGGNDLTLTVSATAAVPEPASVALLGLGACGLLMRRRRVV